MSRTKTASSRAKKSGAATHADRDRITQIVALLNEVARRMQDGLNFEPQAFEHLRKLQSTVQTAIEPSEFELTMPATAPANWLDRANRDENPVEFIRRVYGPWLGKGLSRPSIRRLDKSLYLALYRFLANGGIWPTDLDLPTKKQQNDRELKKSGFASGSLSPDQQEAIRLYHLARRRGRTKNK